MVKQFNRIIIVTLFTLLAVVPVQADTPQFAFYRPLISNDTGLVVYNNGASDYIAFTPAAFNTRLDGLFVMQADGRLVTAYTGIARLSGSCSQSKQSLIGLRLVIDGYSTPLMVIKTDDEVFSFAVPFQAGNVYIQAFNYVQGRYDLLKCDFVLDAVR